MSSTKKLHTHFGCMCRPLRAGLGSDSSDAGAFPPCQGLQHRQPVSAVFSRLPCVPTVHRRSPGVRKFKLVQPPRRCCSAEQAGATTEPGKPSRQTDTQTQCLGTPTVALPNSYETREKTVLDIKSIIINTQRNAIVNYFMIIL